MLPELKKMERGQVARFKKSVKCQLLEDALHTRDKLKIKEIRNYLRESINSKS